MRAKFLYTCFVMVSDSSTALGVVATWCGSVAAYLTRRDLLYRRACLVELTNCRTL